MIEAARRPAASEQTVWAEAHPNIALVKYWGKRDAQENLPATSSVSVTLDTFVSRVGVSLQPEADSDEIFLNGQPASAEEAIKLTRFVDRFRTHLSAEHARIRLEAVNNFPTGAGLASSASGFAALTQALAALFDRSMSLSAMSQLARLGSGSAARSMFGGFVVLNKGSRSDGRDCLAEALMAPDDWPLRLVVAITSRDKKSLGSTAGMERTRLTSPFYSAWLAAQDADVAEARQAIEARDFQRLAAVTTHSATKMHAVMLAASPPLIYWTPATLAALHTTLALGHAGVAVAPTMDAGPQLKALCLPSSADAVAAALRDVPGVLEVVTVGLGHGARLTQGPVHRPVA